MDLEGYWQENRRFVLAVTGGAVAFLIGWWAIDAYLGADVRSLQARRTRVQAELKDPKFQTERLFIRISAAEVRRRLITKKGYTDEQLPSQQTINTKLNMLGYRLTKVAKCRPQKGSRRPTPSSSR